MLPWENGSPAGLTSKPRAACQHEAELAPHLHPPTVDFRDVGVDVWLSTPSALTVYQKNSEEEDRARQVFRVWAEAPWGRCVQLRGPHAAHPTGAKKGQVGDHDGKGHAGAFPWVYYIQHFDPITSPRFSCPETIKLKANKTSKTLGLPVVCFQVFFQCLLRKALSWELHPHTRPHGI